jgi:RNA-splicing ligase RtcB
MLELNGKYNTAKVYTDVIEQEAISQIINMCNQIAFKDSRVRIMPDVHAGKGCTIGTTMTITDKVVPNLVGVDIGCGMLVAKLDTTDIDFAKLDAVIRQYVPSGFAVRGKEHRFLKNVKLNELRFCDEVDNRAKLSLGTLGGGNHFIEVDRNDAGELYLVIHSGSRHLGVETASFYQKEAFRVLSKKFGKDAQDEIITRCKNEGRPGDIQAELQKLTVEYVPQDFAYCEGQLFDDYIHDMKIVQEYATQNRLAMLDEILTNMGISTTDTFTTIHNYIDTKNMILRKGAVSAQTGEKLIIPINMRDGSLICTGRGNEDWNCSAPHGAGRLMSRAKAKESISLEDFEASMEGIFTTSVGRGTLDESPMAYKSINDILDNVGDTVTVDEIIKPVYNFKASE